MQYRLIAVFFLAVSILLSFPFISYARKDTRVQGHVKKDGKIVSPYKRKPPNKSKLDNYGSKGNLNPNTGKIGNKGS